MDQLTEADKTIDDLYRKTVCPACAYSLQGLPSEGICPECGAAYDSSQIILYGWARGSHATGVNSRGAWWIFRLVPFGMLCPMLNPFTPMYLRVLYVCICTIVIGLSLWRRTGLDHPGGIQLRMNAAGITQIDHLATLRTKPVVDAKKYMPWTQLEWGEWQVFSEGTVRIRLRNIMAWYKFVLTEYPVDAEVTCTKQQAEKLRSLIKGWRNE